MRADYIKSPHYKLKQFPPFPACVLPTIAPNLLTITDSNLLFTSTLEITSPKTWDTMVESFISIGIPRDVRGAVNPSSIMRLRRSDTCSEKKNVQENLYKLFGILL